MGILIPITVFLLLGLSTLNQLFTIAACTFVAWAWAICSQGFWSGRA